MTLKQKILQTFGEKTFARPLFYNYPCGLRFALSASGHPIQQFLQALRKANDICSDIFGAEDALVITLRVHSTNNAFVHRGLLESLSSAGIHIPAQRSIWSEEIAPDDWSAVEPEYWLNVAFEAPVSLLENFLWCALATDFQTIQPNPNCAVYLFNLRSGAVVFPYDDRGMDVVGPNSELLFGLYKKYSSYLLDYDRPAMDDTFTGE